MKISKESRIAVLCGGMSTEREVSLQSGAAVHKALKEYGYVNTYCLDINEANIVELFLNKPDIAFIALHGKYGEDGRIQGLLEFAKIPYTGSGVESSAICMNKAITKQLLKSEGIPTGEFIKTQIVSESQKKKIYNMIIEKMDMPVVLKAPCQGSSIGVEIVWKQDDLMEAIKRIEKCSSTLLIEEYLEGIEVTVPVMGNEDIITLPAIEIAFKSEFYDYKTKYTSGMSEHIIPARISESELHQINRISKDVYKLLNCKGIARIDFIIDNIKGPNVIEVNTVPGMTETSLVPDSAENYGISFGELCSKLLEYGVSATQNKNENSDNFNLL